jgi:hypothetical protein
MKRRFFGSLVLWFFFVLFCSFRLGVAHEEAEISEPMRRQESSKPMERQKAYEEAAGIERAYEEAWFGQGRCSRNQMSLWRDISHHASLCRVSRSGSPLWGESRT